MDTLLLYETRMFSRQGGGDERKPTKSYCTRSEFCSRYLVANPHCLHLLRGCARVIVAAMVVAVFVCKPFIPPRSPSHSYCFLQHQKVVASMTLLLPENRSKRSSYGW